MGKLLWICGREGDFIFRVRLPIFQYLYTPLRSDARLNTTYSDFSFEFDYRQVEGYGFIELLICWQTDALTRSAGSMNNQPG
jgi:hypothetical protein